MDEQVLAWLLEDNDPSVRYMTLTTWLGLDSEVEEVRQARSALMSAGPVCALLEQQNEDGSWGEENRFYRDKYHGAVWSLLLLAELGADPRDARVKKACEFVLSVSQEPEEGGFSYDKSAKTGSGLYSGVIPCLTGNMVYALIKLGYLEDPRVQHAIDWVCRFQRTDDGDTAPPKGKPYDRYEMCWGRHSCHMGVAKTFKALAAIPESRRNEAVQRKLAAIEDYFLKHHIYKKSHDLEQVARPGWLRLGFPLMYQTDLLELLGIFADLKHYDPRLEDALKILKEKRSADGLWKLENSFNGKMRVVIEKKGKPSKWLTLKAYRILRAFGGE
ncbi:prenyltransferase/squalene oxidase repeat-containing protein [Acidaminobacter hydrogenoformans]|uniref:Prenyltransferase and squalene oxidase repeat-containing protein n=1 Tax=Acidaminobacter hydrogenoformans DSM 2784 TaxID=1120920 RepID=A0A1G5S612_9FIRM|nr:prenyltransferase/squalene oxidase repeat-containing protein [Acidaminobacter hydrogenoformans]SCZ81852.1 Prenyltransferase and squalene oxidase repeat-containing protein [Acidaminobacter hydrogenoformans DSM 2784]